MMAKVSTKKQKIKNTKTKKENKSINKEKYNLSFQKTTFYNGECYCSGQQPK